MTAVLGVDGWRGGWVGVRLSGATVAWRAAPVLADLTSPDPAGTSGGVVPAAIGVDMPIGLVPDGARDADVLAQAHLPGAGSRVFRVPPRPVVEQAGSLPPAQLQALSRSLWGQGTSVFALALVPRILELDRLLRADPGLAARVVEVHPELSFATMTAGPPLPTKKSARGVAARVAALADALHLDVLAALHDAPARVPVDDCLDALAAAWSALRWAEGRADSYPDPPGTDPAGLRVAIVV
jgi:predicted RNase H-like nuclease